MQIFNYIYKPTFEEVENFKFETYDENTGIGVKAYEKPGGILTLLDRLIGMLYDNPTSRQAILPLHTVDFVSCFLTMQVQLDLDNKIVYVTTNFRSQATAYKEKDSRMVNYLITILKRELKIEDYAVDMTANVGNYHKINTIG